MAIKLHATANEIELKKNRIKSINEVTDHDEGYPTALAAKQYADSLKVTVDAELSDTSENPVQNKVIMNTFEDFADQINTAFNNINPIRKIRRIELGAGETAQQLTVSTDESGSPLNLNIAFITAHFVFAAADTNAVIRMRTSAADGRYFILQSGVSRKSGSITVGGQATAFGGKIVSDFVYQVGVNQGTAKSTGNYTTISSIANKDSNIPSIETWLYDAAAQYITLKEGSFIEIWGC